MRKKLLLLCVVLSLCLLTAVTGCKPREPRPEPYVPSTDASFTVLSVNQEEVAEGKVCLTETKLNELYAAEDVMSLIAVEVAEHATLNATLNKEARTIDFLCVAEDAVTQSSQTVAIEIADMFGRHSVQDVGSRENAKWSESQNGYVIDGAAAAYDANGNSFADYYVYNFDVTLTGLKTGSEVVISSYQTESLAIRFVLRGVDETHYLLFTDYRENSSFLNYYELKTDIEYTEGEAISFGVIHAGDSMVMLYEGETLFRRTLHSMNHSELVLNRVDYPYVVNNIRVITDEEAVMLAYENALEEYEDPFFGPNSIGYDFLTEQAERREDGSIYIPGATSNERVMGGYFYEGVPVGGHEFAVATTVRMQNTKESGGAASKAEFQLYKDAKNSIKFHMFRYPTNNTLMGYETRNGEQTDIAIHKKEFPTGTDYTFRFLFLYKNGKVELWMHDAFETNSSSLFGEYTLVYEREFDWNHCGFAFAMRQYADITWSDWQVYYNHDFADVYVDLHPLAESTASFSAKSTEYAETDVFTKGAYDDYYKASFGYGKAFIADKGTPVCGDKWIVNLTASFTDYKIWGQGEFQFYQDETNAIRYVLEYQGGNYQVFSESKRAQTAWDNWKLVRRPASNTPAYLNMTAVNDNGSVYLLINGEIWHEYKDTGFTNLYATFGGQNASLKVTEMSVITDAAEVDAFVADMEYYVYESSYESRIKELEKEYADAPKGGIVLAGSSSVDFWDSWQEDLGEEVLAYNMGIGGTTTYDWQVAYSRLIKPMEPSQILLFLGGNDVNGLGEKGVDTAQRLAEMLELMHTDFPSANIVYVVSMPVPNNYSNGQYSTEYGKLVEAMRAYGRDNATWLKTVDLEQYLTSNNKPIPEYFKSDNIHLTEAGYEVWTSQIKPLLVHENTVVKDNSYKVLGGSWRVTQDAEGGKVYTSTADDAFLGFTETVLENYAVVEFDMTLLASGSSIVGMVFGMDSPYDASGFCLGRANTSNPGCAWLKDGAANGFGSGDTSLIKIPYSEGATYHITIECDIVNGDITVKPHSTDFVVEFTRVIDAATVKTTTTIQSDATVANFSSTQLSAAGDTATAVLEVKNKSTGYKAQMAAFGYATTTPDTATYFTYTIEYVEDDGAGNYSVIPAPLLDVNETCLVRVTVTLVTQPIEEIAYKFTLTATATAVTVA